MRQRERLQDKVVVITGAASGIGLATAFALARRGATVIAAGRQGEALEKVAQECRERTGRALAIATDVTHEADVEVLAREAIETFGHIDVWVNNAAVTAFGRFDDVPSEVFRRVIDTNFLGFVNGARAALPIFRKQGRGVLINVASGVAYIPQPWMSAYVCSKFAIRAFSECLRMELLLDQARDIHVCTVLPASIDTPLFQHGANYIGRAAKPIPPVYDPVTVAEAIIGLVQRPRREVFVGAAGPIVALLHGLAPRLFERVAARVVDRNHFQDRPTPASSGNLFRPASPQPQLRGGWRQSGNMWKSAAIIGGAGALVLPLIATWARGARPRRMRRQAVHAP
jgi:NAD(P)-dependent dehydrogenase (short-subunit alcohol dehydrogenase family)